MFANHSLTFNISDIVVNPVKINTSLPKVSMKLKKDEVRLPVTKVD